MRRNAIRICVIGGGFTGVAAAIACLHRVDTSFRLTVVEPAPDLGRGIAFGDRHPANLLNVRARDLTVLSDRPSDFLNWAFRQIDQGESDSSLLEGLAHAFLPRQLFGEYVKQRLFEAVERRGDVEFNIVNAAANSCRREGAGFVVRVEEGDSVGADVVIVATAFGLPRGSSGGALGPFDTIPGERLAGARSIALIGSGLTMVDALFSARSGGFSGTATVLSRRGQLPREHAPKGVVPQEMALPRTKSLSRLTASIRIACEAAELHGTPWQAVVNGLRPSLQAIWRELSVEEQSRFLRHVRPYWDAHRHRIPPELHDRVRSEFDTGRAVLVHARVIDTTRVGSGFVLQLRGRGAQRDETLYTDLAFDCTGHKPDLSSPFVKSLIGERLARPDVHGLGLAVKANGQLKAPGGAATHGLFALGPLCQGSLWEITAVPEIVRQASWAADSVAELARRSCALAS